MLQQTAFPRSPEEVAASLNQMEKEDLRWLDGVIVGLTTARKREQEHAQPAQAKLTAKQESA